MPTTSHAKRPVRCFGPRDSPARANETPPVGEKPVRWPPGSTGEPLTDQDWIIRTTSRRGKMAHEIETMAFFQKTPWHGLGTALHEDDLYDWKKTCEKAGLAWDVELVPLVTDDTRTEVTHKAVRRSTDGKVLGVVGPR